MNTVQNTSRKWMWFGPALLVAGLAVGIGLGAVFGDSDSAVAGLVWVVAMALLALGALLCVAAGITLGAARAGRAARARRAGS